MYKRNSIKDVKAALQDSPVVLINGARQVGKSTLAKILLEEISPLLFDDIPNIDAAYNIDSQYVTLDDATTLSAAVSSPLSFLKGLPPHVVIDEIQRAPQLFLAIKKLVDENRRPGSFLLTGSANVMTLPKLADSLAGRMDIHTLWPLSQGEINNKKECFIDVCFGNKKLPKVEMPTWSELMEIIVCGGYPEVLGRKDPKRRKAWYGSYLTSILERDIRDLANIEGLKEIPNLLQLLAARVGGLLNFSDLSRISKISNTTLKRYMALLESVFIYVPLPAWLKNEEKRIVKSPKIYLNDTGLLCHLRGLDKERLISDRNIAGPILENFVVMELKKQLAWSDIMPKLYHFSTSTGREVDIIMEAPDGRIVAIEIKSSNEVSSHDFSGIQALKEITTGTFHLGIILYTGTETINFASDLIAMPVSALWKI